MAKAEEDKICLYDKEQGLIKEISFEDCDENIKFLYAVKRDSAICFVLSGAVDDESGVMFVNNGSDNFMDGIKSIERFGVSGNSYRYSTN